MRPTGRRRTSAANSSGVGRRDAAGSSGPSSAGSGVVGGGARRARWCRLAGGRWCGCNSTQAARRSEVAAPGGAGEEGLLQGERAEHAALHAVQDGGESVGAEDGGGGGEFRRGYAGGGGRGEVAGVGDEDGDDFENSRDASRNGVGWWGVVGAVPVMGLVIAGLMEQSKNFMIGFLMHGYVGGAMEADRVARLRAGRRAVMG